MHSADQAVFRDIVLVTHLPASPFAPFLPVPQETT
ncbi:MAG: hypothetical protein XXXNARYT_002885 [Candidatus Accumulibacter regalis]